MAGLKTGIKRDWRESDCVWEEKHTKDVAEAAGASRALKMLVHVPVVPRISRMTLSTLSPSELQLFVPWRWKLFPILKICSKAKCSPDCEAHLGWPGLTSTHDISRFGFGICTASSQVYNNVILAAWFYHFIWKLANKSWRHIQTKRENVPLAKNRVFKLSGLLDPNMRIIPTNTLKIREQQCGAAVYSNGKIIRNAAVLAFPAYRQPSNSSKLNCKITISFSGFC